MYAEALVQEKAQGRKLLFLWRQLVNIRLIEYSYGVSIKEIDPKKGRLVVVLDEHISGLNHEAYVFLRKNLEASVINVAETKMFWRKSALSQLLKRHSYALMLSDHLSSSNVVSVLFSRAGC